jgi:hypothetical protein
VNRGKVDMGDSNVGLGYDGQDGTWRAIWVMLGLVVNDNPRSRRGWNWRHLRSLVLLLLLLLEDRPDEADEEG